MVGDYRARQRQAIEEALSLLAEQYAAALLESTLATGAARVQAEQKAAEIDQRMAELEKKKNDLTLAPVRPHCPEDEGPEPDKVHDLLKARLHRIDFAHVEAFVQELLRSECRDGRASLLLFQQSSRRSGLRCAERIVSLLKTEAGGAFRPVPVKLDPKKGALNDADMVLRLMAGHLNLSLTGQSRRALLEEVSATLCGSLQAGGIAFIEIHGCNWLVDNEPTALHWIVTDLWRRLLTDLRAVARRLPGSVTLLAALFSDDQLPAGALLLEHCCRRDDFHRERCLELELRAWTADEVGDWLARFGMPGHPPETIGRIRDLVMRISEGVPSMIEHELLERCAPSSHATIG